MIHYTQVKGLITIKFSPIPIVCALDGGVQLTQVINLPRSPLLVYIIIKNLAVCNNI